MADEDVRLVLARMEGMLQATLPQHAARLDEHDRSIASLSATVTQQGQQLAAVSAVATERATEQRDQAVSRRSTPPWVAVASLLVAGIAVIVTVLFFAFDH